ncbi:outer membrane receptor FepA [Salmonella enterica subsp. arizonae]|uniref:Outer membrane receptor FepA n=1 Tax=Salmonella enterica subsp. arizonae TaxID=59203 RepID=A0A379T6R0_SALER|nr:outer membrane receptor FepA [Salmonella enterica subsp. arizonae]
MDLAPQAGVVNIITKRPTNDWHGSLSLYTNQPEK